MITGKFLTCFWLIDNWAPEAIETVQESLSDKQTNLPDQVSSCASIVAEKFGASDEQIIMAAGLAGGMGLSGGGCGALATAIWLKTLDWNAGKDGKMSISNPGAESALEAFYKVTDHETLCEKITGRQFSSIEDHTQFIQNGGCDKLIDVLAKT